jgi:hypothetical protein
VSAQSSATIISAPAMGLANASSCLSNEWSLFNNIGGLSKVEAITTSFSQYSVPSFKPFGKIAAVCAVPLDFGVTAAGFYRSGDSQYNEQLLSLGFSNQFGLASLGLKVNYVQYKADGFGARTALTVSFGGLAEITPKFFVGASIENLNQPKLSSDTGERIQSRFTVGTGFKLTEKLLAITEIEKDVINSPVLKAGVQYQLNAKVIARTGFNFNPQSAFGGLGFRLPKFQLDYAIQFHEYFGTAHQATVSLRLPKNK